MNSRVGLVMAMVAGSGLAGCGGGPKLVPTSGVVTLNGKPLGDAEILFLPDNSNKEGLAGADKTGPEGNYKAMTQGRSGLVPGKYKVVITKTTVDMARVPPEFKDDPMMARLVLEGPDSGDGMPVRKSNQVSEIKGEFEREVSKDGGVLDFDVKAGAAKK